MLKIVHRHDDDFVPYFPRPPLLSSHPLKLSSSYSNTLSLTRPIIFSPNHFLPSHSVNLTISHNLSLSHPLNLSSPQHVTLSLSHPVIPTPCYPLTLLPSRPLAFHSFTHLPPHRLTPSSSYPHPLTLLPTQPLGLSPSHLLAYRSFISSSCFFHILLFPSFRRRTLVLSAINKCQKQS